MKKGQKNVVAATKLLAVILSVTTDENEIENLLADFLEGVKENWLLDNIEPHNSPQQ